MAQSYDHFGQKLLMSAFFWFKSNKWICKRVWVLSQFKQKILQTSQSFAIAQSTIYNNSLSILGSFLVTSESYRPESENDNIHMNKENCPENF